MNKRVVTILRRARLLTVVCCLGFGGLAAYAVYDREWPDVPQDDCGVYEARLERLNSKRLSIEAEASPPNVGREVENLFEELKQQRIRKDKLYDLTQDIRLESFMLEQCRQAPTKYPIRIRDTAAKMAIYAFGPALAFLVGVWGAIRLGRWLFAFDVK